jgi:glycosyltransferase involved in cell wall biosynthesis
MKEEGVGKMKVLTLSWEYPPRVIGGIARVVYDLSHQMLNADVENHIITCGSNELPSYEREDDLHIHLL